MSKINLFMFWKIGRSVFSRRNFCLNSAFKYSTWCSYYFGNSKLFSIINVRFMEKFYYCFPNFIEEMNKLSWEHYVELLKICEVSKLYFYFHVAIFCRISVCDLHNIISNNYYDLLLEKLN